MLETLHFDMELADREHRSLIREIIIFFSFVIIIDRLAMERIINRSQRIFKIINISFLSTAFRKKFGMYLSPEDV